LRLENVSGVKPRTLTAVATEPINSFVNSDLSPKIRDGFGQQRPCGVTHVFCALAPSLHQKSGWI
jgi:hypothetical protein